MATINWPETLPQVLLSDGLSGKLKSSVIRTEMDAGPVKARRRYTVSSKEFTGKVVCTESQRLTLEVFFKVTLSSGVLRFNMKDPQTLQEAEFRFMEDYEEVNREGLWDITLKLEKMQ